MASARSRRLDLDQAEALLDDNKTAKDIAARLKCSDRHARKLAAALRVTRCPGSGVNKGGRPRKLMEAIQGSSTTRKDLQLFLSNDCKAEVAKSTLARYLKTKRIRSARKTKKPFLTLRHRTNRMSFVHKYGHLTEEEWARAIFSDESRISI